MIQHARPIIEKHCKALGVDPVEVFSWLLNTLQANLQMGSVMEGFTAKASNQTDVLSEVDIIMQYARTNETPTSLLHAMEMTASRTLAGHLRNEESMIRQAEQNPKMKEEAEHVHRVVNVFEALVLILRDISN